MMEENNTSLLGTPFTVTVDLLGHDCTTGRFDPRPRATIRALADPKTKPTDLGRPGTSTRCVPRKGRACAVRPHRGDDDLA